MAPDSHSHIPLVARAWEHVTRRAIVAEEGIFSYRDLLDASAGVAAILLDGAGVTLGQQRLGEIDPEDVRTGMRVEVEWAEPGAGSPIKHWGPNGEPDVPREQLQEHIL